MIPPPLQPGDIIAIICPSGYLPIEKALAAKAQLEQWGYQVLLGQNIGVGHNYFAGTDASRRLELQRALSDPSIAAVMMGRGGYGLSRIVYDLHLADFARHPKWIIGFSDITLLHSAVYNQTGCASIHGPMCSAFLAQTPDEDIYPSIQSLHTAIGSTQPIHYPIPICTHNRPGRATGVLLGGNLAMLSHAIGGRAQLNTQGAILFLEDIGEHLYKIDRMMIQLKQAGYFEGIEGIIFGSFTDTEDTTRPFGSTLYQILLQHLPPHIPICFDFPAGHERTNYALRLGMQHTLSVSDQQVALLPAGPHG